jgi:hypothetical protein
MNEALHTDHAIYLYLVGSRYQFVVFFSLMPTVTRLRLESREVPINGSPMHSRGGRGISASLGVRRGFLVGIV